MTNSEAPNTPRAVGENNAVTLHEAPAANDVPHVVPVGEIEKGAAAENGRNPTVDVDAFFTVNTFVPTSPNATWAKLPELDDTVIGDTVADDGNDPTTVNPASTTTTAQSTPTTRERPMVKFPPPGAPVAPDTATYPATPIKVKKTSPSRLNSRGSHPRNCDDFTASHETRGRRRRTIFPARQRAGREGEDIMSVLVVARLKVDPAEFQDLVTRRGDELGPISERGRAAGAVHHQFVAGDGEVLIIDEWDDPAHFEAFFGGQPEIADLMADGGVEGPPAVSVYQILDTPDRF